MFGWGSDWYTDIDKGRKTIRLFVYGTLREGYGLHNNLRGCKKVGEGWLHGFKMYARGIPFVVKSDDPNDKVFGEIYEVKVGSRTLDTIDAIEGGYTRTMIADQLGGVDIYLDTWASNHEQDRVPSGDFKDYAEPRPRRYWRDYSSSHEFLSLDDEDDIEICE